MVAQNFPKIQINSPKKRFWKEKSVEDVVTLGPTALATISPYGIAKWVNINASRIIEHTLRKDVNYRPK
jgi:hypothetical protein